jgi:hypothetical protein
MRKVEGWKIKVKGERLKVKSFRFFFDLTGRWFGWRLG